MTKLQASGKSKRDGWRTELPSAGLRAMVIEKMKEEKQKDAKWQGKCSGTVYVFSYDSKINFNTQRKSSNAESSQVTKFICSVQLHWRERI